MHGGMKIYRGSAAAARHYVEADRGRADDYYLAEGTGVAERYVASPDAGVRRMEPLSGDAYEAWVAGFDPDTGVPKGRLRNDDRAVRFVEVVVNGPKSWSLAAELHPDISAAYDAAQDRAATQIIGWLAQHATTRVGPRGAQVQVPVAEIEAVTVRHYTSRAGDPHRHLHLQINARVFAEGHWRGLHTVGVRDSLDAINGIGHAAVMTDPGFREALAAHGFTLDPDTGEIAQLAGVRGCVQRAGGADRSQHRPLRSRVARRPIRVRNRARRCVRAWDARAWADARPDKVVPRDGAEVAQTLGRRAARTRLPRPHRPSRASTRSRSVSVDREQAVDGGAVAARGPPVGVERRRHPRRGRAADRAPQRRHRRSDPRRAGRGPDRPNARTLRPAARPTWGARAHPRAHLARTSSTSRPTSPGGSPPALTLAASACRDTWRRHGYRTR